MSLQENHQWSQFWQQGHITTFGPSLPDNYNGVLRDFWETHFSELPKGSRVLDIATGNGAVATIAAQVSRDNEKDLEINAADLAQINPNLIGEHDADLRASIRFLSAAPCEDLPFPDASVDLATSQFGFEYSDLGASLAELRRILKSEGRFIAVAHHAESRIIQGSQAELVVYASALREFDVFTRMQEFLAALGNAAPGPELNQAMANAKPLAVALNDALNGLRNEHGESPCAQQILGAVTHLAKGAGQASGDQRMAAVGAASADFRMGEQRLVDMVAAGMDADDMDILQSRASEVGFTSCTCEEFRVEDNELVGWKVELA